MSQPEEYREDVYLSEGYQPDAIRGDLGGQLDTRRETMAREALREEVLREASLREALMRESQYREALPREPLAQQPFASQPFASQPMGRELGREAMSREGFSREPLSREPGGRVTGSPLPGTPLPTGSGYGAGISQESQAHRTVPPGRSLSMTGGPCNSSRRRLGDSAGYGAPEACRSVCGTAFAAS
jgi:hypothetical protein